MQLNINKILMFFLCVVSLTVAGQELELTIVPHKVSVNGDKVFRSISIYSRDSYFDIVLRNKGKQTIRIWTDWNSWGYKNLRFEVIDERGKTYIVERRIKGWDKNFPDYYDILPGKSYIMKVSFQPIGWESWPNSPLKLPGSENKIKMKAIYESKDWSGTTAQDIKKYKVWTGRVDSEMESYILFH